MTCASIGGVPHLSESLVGERPHHREHLEPGICDAITLGCQHRLFTESLDDIEDGPAEPGALRENVLRRSESKSAAKRGASRKGCALIGIEQVPGGGDGTAHRGTRRAGIAGAATKGIENAVEPSNELVHVEHVEAGRCKLEREWYSLELGDELGHRPCVSPMTYKIGTYGARSVNEEPYRVCLATQVIGQRERQGREGKGDLARQAQAHAGRHQEAELRCCARKGSEHGRARVGHVLEPIEHHEPRTQGGQRISNESPLRVARRGELQGTRDGFAHPLGIANVRKLAENAGLATRELVRQTGFSHAGRAEEGDDAGSGKKELADGLELCSSPDEPVEAQWRPGETGVTKSRRS